MQKLIWALSLVALGGCGDGNPGAKTADVPEVIQYPSPPPSPSKPKALPFDGSQKNVGANFAGHDCREVARALKAKSVHKDQYESTKEFNARIAKLKESTLYDDVRLGSVLAFVDSEKGYENYDADKGVLNFTAPYIGYNLAHGESHPKLTAFKRSSNERDYVGKNAFGVTADVKYVEEEVCVVTMANLPFEGLDKRRFKIKAVPDQAKSMSGNIGTAYVGILMPPYVGSYREYQKPEISRPKEVVISGDDVRFRLQQLLVFNRSTGEILDRRVFK